jgi:hypothetical protein
MESTTTRGLRHVDLHSMAGAAEFVAVINQHVQGWQTAKSGVSVKNYRVDPEFQLYLESASR